jgi:hypothetical protein
MGNHLITPNQLKFLNLKYIVSFLGNEVAAPLNSSWGLEMKLLHRVLRRLALDTGCIGIMTSMTIYQSQKHETPTFDVWTNEVYVL